MALNVVWADTVKWIAGQHSAKAIRRRFALITQIRKIWPRISRMNTNQAGKMIAFFRVDSRLAFLSALISADLRSMAFADRCRLSYNSWFHPNPIRGFQDVPSFHPDCTAAAAFALSYGRRNSVSR